ncbi:hypothetical protein LTR64_000813 [Lithohypha guttulata]|uniref:uncharacterized protein n=1 Tax=Lithohypha guttulata TaxID=1690604 RepID=UPI002DE08090|nr:hypothetical protein LTR51_005421 [Lithohypha guttulata]
MGGDWDEADERVGSRAKGGFRQAQSTCPDHSTEPLKLNSKVAASMPLTAAIFQNWNFDQVPTDTNLRGGGCVQSLPCDVHSNDTHLPATMIEIAEKGHVQQVSVLQPSQEAGQDEDEDENKALSELPAWTGWAELENDPDIFTIILEEWGVPNVQVNEVTAIEQLIFEANASDILGLIFLARYVPPEEADTGRPTSAARPAEPWFANQISKYSCGTVALMNILMNSTSDHADKDLSEILSAFKNSTLSLSAKQRGVALDTNPQFRNIHNSFSTQLDRMIVDVLLKEDAQKHKARMQAQAKRDKQAAQQTNGNSTSTKRKRGKTTFTQRRKRKSISDADEEDEAGFHFVAYLSHQGVVWKMDGMQSRPTCLGYPTPEQTWLNAAATDLIPRMQEAFNSGQNCSLMSLTRTSDRGTSTEQQIQARKLESERRQEDWAPFIEHVLRLHAERGDLQEMLGF